MYYFRKLFGSAALLLVASLAQAQQTINNASLSGQVYDPSGRAIQNARVTAVQIVTGRDHSLVTDTEGRFRFPYLSLGTYRISVEQPGFAAAIREVELTVGA